MSAGAYVWAATLKRFKRPVADPEPDAVALEVLSEDAMKVEKEQGSLLHPSGDSKPQGSILTFSAVEPEMSSRFNHVEESNAKSSGPAVIESRGAAALQLFLIVYISPVEICLKMLTCFNLPNL